MADQPVPAADGVRLTDYPLEVRNALIMPVYEVLTEDQALDCVADEVVERQIADLRRWGWDVRRTDAR